MTLIFLSLYRKEMAMNLFLFTSIFIHKSISAYYTPKEILAKLSIVTSAFLTSSQSSFDSITILS